MSDKCAFSAALKSKSPLIMGILNVTPDSFSDGGKYYNCESAVNHALQMINDGADIIDIGGQSTRPGFKLIPSKDEIDRIAPVIKEIRKKSDILISVDTFYPETAEKALSLGADIVNDVSGDINDEMACVVKKHAAYWVVTCTNALEGDDICNEVLISFEQMAKRAVDFGICKDKLIFDPGFGFGKTREQDIFLFKNLRRLCSDRNVLVGVSRKRMIGVLSGEQEPTKRDSATLTADIYAALAGAAIIRTHRVENHKKAFDVIKGICEATLNG